MTVSSINFHKISGEPATETQIAEIPNPTVDDIPKILGNGELDNSGVQFDEIELNTNKVSSFQATPNDTKFPTEKLTKDSLDLKVNISDVKDNLTSTDPDKPLSANQGKQLEDNKVNISDIKNNLTSTDTDKPLSANQGKQLEDNKVNISDIKNNLTSTDATKPLSANQGKILNDTKANKVASPTDGNLIKTDSNGNPVDTGIPSASIYKARVMWAYQDFSAGSITGTSVNLNAISGYSDLTFSASNIINSAFIVRSDNLTNYAYTGTTALFSSKIKVNSISGATVTLSGIPHSSYAIRIYYQYSSSFYPSNYTPPPKILSASALDALDPIIVTQTEFENVTSSNTNGANQLVKLNASGELPALDASNLTGIPAGNQLSETLHCNDNVIEFRGSDNSPDSNHFIKYNSTEDGVELKSNTTTLMSSFTKFTGSKSISASYGYFNSGGNSGTSSGTNVYSAEFTNRILTGEVNVTSDERIKDIIGVSDSKQDLDILKKLEITDYSYIDTLLKGNQPRKKLIAQQVEKHFPQAVSRVEEFIPSIYKVCKVENSKIFCETKDLKINTKLKIITESNKDESEKIVTITDVQDNFVVVDASFKDEKVFVYGEFVDDFRVVDYESVSMLAVSALQQLEKKFNFLEEKLNEKGVL